ncbi:MULTISPECIES: ABC transporter permease [Staphylococcus]|uniref:ABC transporter permease n=1 Tax=Staphylococcus hsinchuensis TaxID=3051183 RepID=A0ABZ3EE47_9STAP|nr:MULTISPECIES: ABC transporter permease [unclassified Staphylococcus]
MMAVYLSTELKVLFRKKLYLLISILLPVAFYLLFTSIIDLPANQQQQYYKEYMYSMAVFSLMSFCLMSFPLDMIEERNNGWYRHLMATPLRASQYFSVKVIRTMIQFALAIIIMFTVAHAYKGVTMSLQNWILSGITLWFGASLFLTLGLVIAQLKDSQKASSLANLLNLGLAIVGGLWFPVNTFPKWMQHIATKTPTYYLKNIAYDFGKDHGVNIDSFVKLVGYSLIFLFIALMINKKRKEI